jgi:hypothetical protein
MSVMILETATRNAACNAIVDLIDVGGAGTLVFQTSGDVAVATLAFGATAFGNAATGTATANAITSDTNAAGGTIAQVSAFSGGATKIFELDAGTSGTYMIVSSTSVGAGDTVACSALTVTVPAS